MGLGPPVCEKCEVVGKYNREKPHWECPVCGNDHMKWSAWDCGISEEQLIANLKFFNVALGKEENDTSADR